MTEPTKWEVSDLNNYYSTYEGWTLEHIIENEIHKFETSNNVEQGETQKIHLEVRAKGDDFNIDGVNCSFGFTLTRGYDGENNYQKLKARNVYHQLHK